MGLLKGEWVLLIIFWFFSLWIILWMGIMVFWFVWYCWWCIVEVVIGICCFFIFSSFIVDGFFDSLGSVFNCLMFFVVIVVILNAYLSFFGFLNYLFWSKFMSNMCGASGLVIIGCFFYLFLVSFILVFINVNFWDFFVTLVIEIDFVFICFDGISVYCELVLINVLYFLWFSCVSLMNLYSLNDMVFFSFYLVSGSAPLSLVIFFFLNICFGGFFKGISHVIIIIIMFGSLVMGNWSCFFFDGSFFLYFVVL